MERFIGFLKLVLGLTVLMFGTWLISAAFLPEGLLRPYFSRLFSARVGELTFWRVFLANLLIPFLGVQFMNLFRVGKYAGGVYVLPIFWVLYGLLLGTNSFVFSDGGDRWPEIFDKIGWKSILPGWLAHSLSNAIGALVVMGQN